MTRQERAADERLRIVAAARDLLTGEGPAALTTRRIADAAGVTTMALYSRFGGKEHVVAELYAEGFDALRARIESLAPAPPHVRLAAGARAYRAFALDDPWRYAVMFERIVGEFRPTAATRDRAGRALAALHAVVAALPDTPAPAVPRRAHQLWALCHGLVSLELAGWTESADGEGLLDEAVRDLTSRW